MNYLYAVYFHMHNFQAFIPTTGLFVTVFHSLFVGISDFVMSACHAPARKRLNLTSLSVHCIVDGGCTSVLVNRTGTITSPNYPINYPNNAFCQWIVDSGSNSTSVVS